MIEDNLKAFKEFVYLLFHAVNLVVESCLLLRVDYKPFSVIFIVFASQHLDLPAELSVLLLRMFDFMFK